MTARTRTVAAAALALAFLSVTSCTDTTVQPKSSVTTTNIFSDPNSYQSFIARVYAGLAVTGMTGPNENCDKCGDISGIDEGFSQYVRLHFLTEEISSDNGVIGWGDPGLPEMNTQMWTASSDMVVAMYYRVYFQIGMANEFLRQTTDALLDARGNVTPALKTQIHGWRAEARFLRALSYWHAIDLFGSVPLVTENDAIGATPPKQATRDSVYNFIVSELTAIIPQLPAPSAATYGRATNLAAQMLLAKVYMNAAVYTGTPHWTEAMTAVTAVIAGPYSLNPVWRNNFTADNNLSPEFIFAVPFDGLHTRTWGGTTFMIHASCGGSMNNNTYGIDGCWWGVRLKPEAYNRYFPPAEVAGDNRSSFFYTSGQNVAVASIGNFNDGIAAPKFTNMKSTGGAGQHGTFPDTDFPMFRLADAYLMYAELNLRGGGGSAATALNYVNAIRQRAYGGNTGDITAGQLNLQFVLDERGRELLWEGHRRTDLIRFGQYTGATYLWSWKGGTQAGASTAAFRDLFPLPANELIANPNLTQNTGY